MVESNYYEEPPNNYKPIEEKKAYALRMKRHDESILAIHSPQGIAGDHLITASADENMRIWDMGESSMSELISFKRPADSYLLKSKNMANGPSLIKLIENNNSNQPDPVFEQEDQEIIDKLPKAPGKHIPTFITFSNTYILAAYNDGLICCWDIESGKFNCPMIGHSNRVNYIHIDESQKIVFSGANDCTVREWDIKTGVCERVYNFSNPVTVIRLAEEWNQMLTASWDKMIRVIDMKEGLSLKSFTASKEMIREMIIINDRGSKNEIVVAGCENTFRSYNIETGNMKEF